jgi:hypothetical protein
VSGEAIVELQDGLFLTPRYSTACHAGRYTLAAGVLTSHLAARQSAAVLVIDACDCVSCLCASTRVCARGNVLVTVVVTVTGCALVIRGRFSLELHGGFLRMVGKSSEFKVLYKNIARMYYLPRPSHASAETVRYCFVISLEEPMRQGQQRYAHLIMQLEVKHVDIPVNLPEVRASVLQCVRQQPLLRAMQHAVRRALSGEWDHGDGMCVCVCVCAQAVRKEKFPELLDVHRGDLPATVRCAHSRRCHGVVMSLISDDDRV